MKKKGLILRIIGFVLLAVTYIGFAFNFVAVTISANGSSKTNSLSYEDFTNLFKIESDKLTCYKVANVLMIITLVVVGIILILSIIDMFLNNKILSLVTKISATAGIILSVLFFVMFVAGGIAFSTSTTVLTITTSTTYNPHVAPFFIWISAMLGSIFSLVAAKKASRK